MKYVPEEPPASGLVADGDSLMREFNRALGVVYNDIDNNNIIDNSVSAERIVHPREQWEESTSIFGTPPSGHYPDAYPGFTPSTGQLSSLHAVHFPSEQTLSRPALGESGYNEKRPHGEHWETVTNLSLDTVTLQEATELNVYGSGQIRTGFDNEGGNDSFGNPYKFNPRTCVFDVRLVDNGTPTGDFVTVSTMGYGWVPFLVISRRLYLAGEHSFRLQIKSKSGPPLFWTNTNTGLAYAWMPVLSKPPTISAMSPPQVSNTIIAAIGFVR